MNRLASLGPFGILLCLFAGPLFAAELTNTNPPTVRVPNALPGFRLKQGFRIEQVADDSQVCAPAALAFDENGRLFVAEMRDYPNRHEQSPHLGRIRLLEDTDGDGVFDSSIVFADNLPLPSALACYDGGVFVAATPDIVYFKDLNGDGVADERKIVFSGFGNESSRLRSDYLVNNFAWGLDGRIHAGAGGIGGVITSLEVKGAEPVTLGRNDFSFDPRTLTLTVEAGSAQTGLTYDNRGRKFYCDFTHPLRQAIFEPRYFGRNPYFSPPQGAVDCAPPLAPIFRLAPLTPAIASTPGVPRKASPISTIPSATWFTRARGCVVYRGSAFPSNYVGNGFVADSEAHCIQRLVLRDRGLEVAAARPVDDQNTEFLISSDALFHPSQIVNSPDGVLYVADFRDGGDSGRILRIVPDKFKQPKPPQLGKANTYDLAANLAHLNGWHRETAARLLLQKKDPAAIGLLTNMVANARAPLPRLHALALLDALGGLSEGVVFKALHDSDPAVRERAVLGAEKLAMGGFISDSVWNQLRLMTGDFSPSVRYQLALTLGQFQYRGRPQVLAQMLQGSQGDRWMQAAIFSSLGYGAGECFLAVADDGSTRNNPAGLELLRRMAIMIGTQGSLDEVSWLVDWLDRTAPIQWQQWQQYTFVLTAALGEGLHNTGSSLFLVDPKRRLERIYTQALNTSTDYYLKDSMRVDAIRLMAYSPYSLSEIGDWPFLSLGSGQSDAVQSAAIFTLGAYPDARVASSLLGRWSVLNYFLRQQVLTALFLRTDRLDAVMDAIESGRVSAGDLSSAQVNVLRTHSNSGLRQRALQLFGPVARERPNVLENFRPALRLAGDSGRGRELYRTRCANCHRMGDDSASFGADLADMRALSREELLSAIVQPNAELQPQHLTYVIETKGRELRVGLMQGQNPRTVRLRVSTEQEVILPRVNFQTVQPQPWSLMPEVLEQGLNPGAMADLMAFIMAPSK